VKDLTPLFKILRTAIKREVEAFNYYRMASKASPLEETRALLIQLAEEERRHKLLLLQEILTLKRFAREGKGGSIASEEVNYPLPEELPLQRFTPVPQVEVTSLSLPGVFMGGDCFRNFPWEGKDGENALGIMLFDVMGHGLKATGLKARLTEEIGHLSEVSSGESWLRNFSPANLVSRLNQALAEDCERGPAFITFFSGLLHRGTLFYTSAGHEPPLLLSGQGGVQELSETQLPLGVDKGMVYSQVQVRLGPGDILLLFSDGLIEAENGEEEPYGRERLVNLLKGRNDQDAEEMLKDVMDSLRDFLAGNPLRDELTVATAQFIPGVKSREIGDLSDRRKRRADRHKICPDRTPSGLEPWRRRKS